MTADDFFDAPETPSSKSKWQSWGYYYFKDGLRHANVDFLEPNKEQQSVMRVAGRPVLNSSGQVVDVKPFLQPRPSRRLSEAADKLFSPSVCYPVRVVRYFGPMPEKGEDGKREGPPQLHFIDEHPPHVRRQYMRDGLPLPPTCMDILLGRAPSVVGRYNKYRKFYQPDNDFESCLRKPTTVWFLNGLCLNHGKVDCSPDNPLSALHLLGWTAYKSMMDLLLTENPGYVYPEGADHTLIGTRTELARRFVNPDLTNPDGAPALVFTYHKQKRKSVSGGSGGESRKAMDGNRYAASLSSEIYPFSLELQTRMWTPPEDLFWYPSPLEAYNLMLTHASDPDWYDFLVLLARGTDLDTQPEQEPGVSMEAPVNSREGFQPPKKAAPREGVAEQDSAEEPPFDVEEAGDGGYEDEAAPAPAPKPAMTKPLGLGADFGKRAPGEVHMSQEEKNEGSTTIMPTPDPAVVFGNAQASAAADLPESVEARTQSAKERLARMRQGGQ